MKKMPKIMKKMKLIQPKDKSRKNRGSEDSLK